LDSALQGLDLIDLGETEVLAIDEGLDGAQELLAEFEIARDRAKLDESLALPGSAQGIVIRKRAGERARQRTAVPLRPETEIDAVGLAAIGMGRQQANHLTGDP